MDLRADLGIPRFGDGDVVLPDAEAFPEMVRQVPIAAEVFRSSSEVLEEDSSFVSADARLRSKRRVRKALPYDKAPELRNADLAYWSDNYVRNMAIDTHTKMQYRAPKLSRQNATFWVSGFGIGAIGSTIKHPGLISPLDMFAGDALTEALTGVVASVAGRKRNRDEEGYRASATEERRVRMRDGGDDELRRPNELPMNEDESLAILREDVSLIVFRSLSSG